MSDYDESDSDEERADGSLPSFTEFGARGMFELYQVCPPPSTPPFVSPLPLQKIDFRFPLSQNFAILQFHCFAMHIDG